MDVVKLYFKPKLIAIFFVGFASGIPLLLTASTLAIWLTREGVDRTSIGLFAAVGAPYSLKFLWSFSFDYFKLPYLTKKLGRRSSWLMVMQFFLIVSIIFLGYSKPQSNIQLTVIAAFLVSFFSASQDIILDAYRIEILEPEEQALGAAMNTYGYRIAMFVSGAGALILADRFNNWHQVYMIMAAMILVGMMAVLINGEPKLSSDIQENQKPTSPAEIFKDVIINPFADFAKKENWFAILMLIVCFKIPDAIIATIISNFYVSMGFTNIEIAVVVKSFGFAMTMLGVFLGGVVSYKIGVMKTLLISSFLLPLSNLVFILQNNAGHNLNMLYFVIANENLAGAISNVVIIAYLSSLCSKNYTASQFALLASLSSVGRSFLSMPSGYIVDQFGWNNFFIFSCLIGIPGILIVIYLMRKSNVKLNS